MMVMVSAIFMATASRFVLDSVMKGHGVSRPDFELVMDLINPRLKAEHLLLSELFKNLLAIRL